MPKPGEPVIYFEGERSFVALVSHAHTNIPSHLGEQGEPLVDLVIVDPEVKPVVGSVGRDGMIRKLTDIVHASHQFTDKYKHDHGLKSRAEIAAHRGYGEWREMPMFAPIESPDVELSRALNDERNTSAELRDRIANLEGVIKRYNQPPAAPGSSPSADIGPGQSASAPSPLGK